MKRIFQYIAAFILPLVMVTGCSDNENWRIITDVQPGTYVTGEALIYSAVATSSALKWAALDGAPDGTTVTGIYTWIEANKEFFVLRVDAEGNEVSYGKGSVVASSPFETVSLQADATGFTVSEEGLYHIVYNNADNQLTIVPAKFGIIGDATPGAWDSETVMAQSINKEQAIVEMTLKDVSLDKKQLKFRYAQSWGIAIPYGGATVTFHSNMGNVSDPREVKPMTAAFAECSGGGENFSLDKKGTFDVTLQLDLRSGVFSAKAVLTGEDTSSAELPEKMFINGSPFSEGWDWAVAPEMTPIHSHDGMFWGIYYFDAGAEMKFNNAMAWDGNDFGTAGDAAVGYGEFETGGNNLKIENAGYYQVIIETTLSEDKKSVLKKIILSEPVPYVIGDCAASGWDDQLADVDKFILQGDTYVSPTLREGNLRMCIKVEGCDWWQTEFNIFDGKIVYRGKGGDQDAVPAAAGQKAYLKFSDDTAKIE